MKKRLFIGGGLLLLGVIGASFVIKKLYFDKKKENENGKTEENYEDGYQGDFEFEDDVDEDEDEMLDDEPVEVNPEPKPEPEQKSEEKTSSYTDYRAQYDDDDDEEDPDLSDMDIDISQEHLDDSDKDPEIIDGGSLGELSNRWDQETLYFYQENGALVDESMTEIHDPMRFVGSTIEDSGFVDNDELMLFVKNYQFDTVYTIQKIKGAFGDE